jgi:intracellular sulfur oxidation DsrE/DsrF family protein
MKFFRTALAVLILACATCSAASAMDKEEKVVYHINEAGNQMAALNYARNHMIASPKAKIVVVAHGPGIDFLLDGAKDKNGDSYATAVQDLSKRGVQFRICNNTLEARKIDRKRVIPEATVVPSGIAEVSRLQTQEGYAYIKP